MGAPIGNQNAAKANEWSLALKRALSRRGEGDYRKGLDLLADKVVEKAIEGDDKAYLQIGDRFDGKPRQSVEVEGDLKATITIEAVKFADTPAR